MDSVKIGLTRASSIVSAQAQMCARSTSSSKFLTFLEHVGKRNKSFNSAQWLERRLKDPYLEKAKVQNYRFPRDAGQYVPNTHEPDMKYYSRVGDLKDFRSCRSAFKLLEIDEKYKIIKAGQCVIDVGAAPGSWTQVLVDKTNALGENPKKPRGTVISVDRLNIHPVEGARILSGMDFTKPSTQKKIQELTNGRKLDFVFSDMAPNATGVRSLDSDKIFNLAACVLSFAVQNLHPDGGCLVKMWEGRHEEIACEMNRFFNCVRFAKPNSSQKESSEIFLLARNFKGLRDPRR